MLGWAGTAISCENIDVYTHINACSLQDSRPSKRRRIEVTSGDRVYSRNASQLQPCSVCNTLFSPSQTRNAQESCCASCKNACCQRCLSYCDAALLLAPQRTPPLLDDDSLSSGSSPSTPNRFSTPEPFDPNVLRARLLSAAAETAAAHQQRSSVVVDRHGPHTGMRGVGNGIRAETGIGMEAQTQNHDHHHHVVPHSHAYAFDARFSNNTHEQAPVLPPLILQQRQELLLIQLQQRPGVPPIQKKRKRTESEASSLTSSSTNAKLAAVSSQHQQSNQYYSHSVRQAPCALSPIYPSSSCLYHADARQSALNQTWPSTTLASDVRMDMAGDEEQEQERHGCNARLCLNCLVQTADGHKICIPCLEESIMT